MLVDDPLFKKRSVVHCSPHVCLISNDYKVHDLCLTFNLEVSWALSVDDMHSGSISSHRVIFPGIKERVTRKSGIPVHEAP